MGLLDDRLSGNDSRKRCGGGQPPNAGECHGTAKIMGTGCNHHEMMAATEKRIPVNIIFYLVKVISPVFSDSIRILRFPKIRKIHARLQE